MSRIAGCAAAARESGRSLLIPYLVAGDPDLETSLALMVELAAVGADMIELGIPFSDPSADGPAIQRGVERALAAGANLRGVLELARRFREIDGETPLVLMGYLNPIEIMGYAEFAGECALAGVDGVLVVDMPPGEAGDLPALLAARGIDRIFLVSPTTTAERAKEIIEHTSGYLYYVSLKGVTGAALDDRESVAVNIARLRGWTDLPVVIGFGIKDAGTAAAMSELADGVIIGSALVERIARLPPTQSRRPDDVGEVTALIGSVRRALDARCGAPGASETGKRP